MKFRFAILIGVALLLGLVSHAEQLPGADPQTMSKIVVRAGRLDEQSGALAAEPRTLYRAGARYCRIEEAPNPDQSIHGLTIVAKPDTWLVNYYANSAQHFVEPGPVLHCRLPIFADAGGVQTAEGPRHPLHDLEFGRELAFFRERNAEVDDGPLVDGNRTRVHSLKLGEIRLRLFTIADNPEKPLAIALEKPNDRIVLRYDAHEELPFNPALFAKPKGMRIEEAP